MSAERRNDRQVVRITMIGMMAAMIFIGNYLRIPFMGTKLTVVNALCVISGLIFGASGGFWAAGIGSLLYDVISGYGLESLITFVSKGAIGLIAGIIGAKAARAEEFDRKAFLRVVIASVLGAFVYVALYMLKTFIMGPTVKGLTMEATLVSMASKLPGSVINAIFASVAGPLLFSALRPALRHLGIWQK